VNTTSGLISGVPVAAATSNAMLSATNAAGTATQALTLTGHFLQQACHGHTPQRSLTNRAALLAHLNQAHQALLTTAHAA
jgi:hypothetical protein